MCLISINAPTRFARRGIIEMFQISEILLYTKLTFLRNPTLAQKKTKKLKHKVITNDPAVVVEWSKTLVQIQVAISPLQT